MSIYETFKADTLAAIAALKSAGKLPLDLDLASLAAAITVDAPRDPTNGDLACNAGLVLAKPAKLKPRDIAEAIKSELALKPTYLKIDVAGPGFLNVTLAPSAWQAVVAEILANPHVYGRGSQQSGTPVNVEYVSANPTGPMHVGHTRGAVMGDVVANLIAFTGRPVTREYYINDAGGQVDILAKSAFLRYREALGENIGPIPDGWYPGDYLRPVGEMLAKEFGAALKSKPEADWLPLVRTRAIAMMLEMIRDDLATLNIQHDVFTSEAELKHGDVDLVDDAIRALNAKGCIFQGHLPKPLGHEADDWEDREQTLFRSSAFGDSEDRALKKSDGSYTYFAGDVGYHKTKLDRGFGLLVNIFGADHIGYIPRIKASVKALSDGRVPLEIEVCNLVKLMRNGEPVKMSKRSGNIVTLREVVDEVGRDPVRFMMVYRKSDTEIEFDLAKVVEQSKDNPVFYVQYAHARAQSIGRQAAEVLGGAVAMQARIAKADLSLLVDAGEIDIIKRLERYPDVVARAAAEREPHKLAFYLNDVAATFHGHYAQGNTKPHLRFIQTDDRAVTAARLALAKAVATVISSGLGLLGVSAPSEMS